MANRPQGYGMTAELQAKVSQYFARYMALIIIELNTTERQQF